MTVTHYMRSDMEFCVRFGNIPEFGFLDRNVQPISAFCMYVLTIFKKFQIPEGSNSCLKNSAPIHPPPTPSHSTSDLHGQDQELKRMTLQLWSQIFSLIITGQTNPCMLFNCFHEENKEFFTKTFRLMSSAKLMWEGQETINYQLIWIPFSMPV